MAKPFIYPKCNAEDDPRVVDLITQLSFSLKWHFSEKNFKETFVVLNALKDNEFATIEQVDFLDNVYKLDIVGYFADGAKEFFGNSYPNRIPDDEARKIISDGKLKSVDLIDFFLKESEYNVFHDPIRNHPVLGLHGTWQAQYNSLIAAVCQFLSLDHSRRDQMFIYVTPPDGPAMLFDENSYNGMSEDWCWHMYSPCEFITYSREYNAYIPDLYAIKQFVLNRQNTSKEELMQPKVISSVEYDKLSEEEKFSRAFPDPADRDRDKTKTFAFDISEDMYKLALSKKESILSEIKSASSDQYDVLQQELTVWSDIVNAYDAIHDKDDNPLLTEI